MSDLVEFLRARLDDDEQVALAASPGPWHPNAGSDEVVAVDEITVCDGFALSGNQLRATVEHIARHDPARVLAEVEAKRKIISEHALQPASGPDLGGYYGCETCYDHPQYGIPPYGECPTLKLLALPYADHPDYDEAWRP